MIHPFLVNKTKRGSKRSLCRGISKLTLSTYSGTYVQVYFSSVFTAYQDRIVYCVKLFHWKSFVLTEKTMKVFLKNTV